MTLRQEIEKLRDDFEKGDTLSQLIAVTLTSILSRHTEEATVQDWAFILSNAIKHLKEEEIAGLCFDLYCRSSLQEVIDVKINTHKAQQPNGTIADAQAVHEYGTQSTAPSQRERKMKKVQLFFKVSDFESFVNRTDIEILQVDVKAVEQSFCFQEGFSAVVFYHELNEELSKTAGHVRP